MSKHEECTIFCLRAHVQEMEETAPTVAHMVEHGVNEDDAVFSREIFDETLAGLHRVLDKFGCSSDAIRALQEISRQYEMTCTEAHKHMEEHEKRLQGDSEKLDNLMD